MDIDDADLAGADRGNRFVQRWNQPARILDRSDADAWVIHLKAAYAPATVGRTIKGARQLFKAACRAEIITRNPFEDLKADISHALESLGTQVRG